jgi:CheY-like chemotaxis protein
MAELLNRSIGPAIDLQLPAPATLKPVLGDRNQLELALLNLVVNARDAMPHGGTIAITVAEEVAPASLSKLAGGAYIVLRVRDTGSGMDAETLARATEPFFTTKGIGKGTGLGLSMVAGLAYQFGGQLQLSSRPDAGTTAELWLPVADSAAMTGSGAALAADPWRTQPLKVLMVDDDSLVLESTSAMLEELGHTVLQAGSAAAALQTLRTVADVELLLTDHSMPNMTGSELIEEALRTRPELPVILATGYSQPGSTLPPGVIRLGKPFGQDELAKAIVDARGRG